MNKNLSSAIEKAVEKINPKDNFPINQNKADKKPDLFSLTFQTMEWCCANLSVTDSMFQ